MTSLTDGPPPELRAVWRVWWRRSTVRLTTVAGLLGAACVAWAATPPGSAGRAARSSPCSPPAAWPGASASWPRPPWQRPGRAPIPGLLARLGLGGLDQLRRLPWAEGVTLGALALEAFHPARPWHTAVLGVALLAYLLATHLAESTGAPGEASRGTAQPGAGAGRRAGVAGAGGGIGAAALGRGRRGRWLAPGRRRGRRGAGRRPGPARLTDRTREGRLAFQPPAFSGPALRAPAFSGRRRTPACRGGSRPRRASPDPGPPR